MDSVARIHLSITVRPSAKGALRLRRDSSEGNQNAGEDAEAALQDSPRP